MYAYLLHKTALPTSLICSTEMIDERCLRTIRKWKCLNGYLKVYCCNVLFVLDQSCIYMIHSYNLSSSYNSMVKNGHKLAKSQIFLSCLQLRKRNSLHSLTIIYRTRRLACYFDNICSQ